MSLLYFEGEDGWMCVCEGVHTCVSLQTSGTRAGKAEQIILQNYLCTTVWSDIWCRCWESSTGIIFRIVWKRFLFFSEWGLFLLPSPLEPNAIVTPRAKLQSMRWILGSLELMAKLQCLEWSRDFRVKPSTSTPLMEMCECLTTHSRGSKSPSCETLSSEKLALTQTSSWPDLDLRPKELSAEIAHLRWERGNISLLAQFLWLSETL